MHLDVEVREFPAMELACIHHTGPYQGDQELFGRLFGTLMQWAGTQGCLNSPDLKILSLYYDDPETTEPARQRMSVAITVPENIPGEGQIERMQLPAGTYAVARVEVLPDQYGEAWQSLVGEWLPASGHHTENRPSMEVYLNDPKQHPEGKHIVEMCLPVKAGPA